MIRPEAGSAVKASRLLQVLAPSLRAGATRHDLLVQFLIDGLHRAVDLGTGRAELIGNQLHQQVDPLDEGRAAATARAADDGLSRLSAALAYLANGT